MAVLDRRAALVPAQSYFGTLTLGWSRCSAHATVSQLARIATSEMKGPRPTRGFTRTAQEPPGRLDNQPPWW